MTDTADERARIDQGYHAHVRGVVRAFRAHQEANGETDDLCDQHARIRRQGRVDGMRDIEIAAQRSYRLGALEGTLRAVLGLLVLVTAARWMETRE